MAVRTVPLFIDVILKLDERTYKMPHMERRANPSHLICSKKKNEKHAKVFECGNSGIVVCLFQYEVSVTSGPLESRSKALLY
jgi:hypothetical protein